MARKIFGLLSMMAMFAHAIANPKAAAELSRKIDGDSGLSRERKQELQNEILKEHGVKQFTIDGITVMAINEKNAIRKVNRIKDERFSMQVEEAQERTA